MIPRGVAGTIQTSGMELHAKKVNGFKVLTIFVEVPSGMFEYS